MIKTLSEHSAYRGFVASLRQDAVDWHEGRGIQHLDIKSQEANMTPDEYIRSMEEFYAGSPEEKDAIARKMINTYAQANCDDVQKILLEK